MKTLLAVLITAVSLGALGASLFIQRVLPGQVAEMDDARRGPGLYLTAPWQRWETTGGATTFVLAGANGSAGAVVTFAAPISDDKAKRIEADAGDLLAEPDLVTALAPYGAVTSHLRVPAAKVDPEGVRETLLQKLTALESRAAAEHAAAAEISGTIEAKVAELNALEDAAYGAREAALLAEIEALQTEAVVYTARRQAESRAQAQAIRLEAELSLSQAMAQRDGLIGAAVAKPGGRYYAAIEAARRFNVRHLAHAPEGLAALRKTGTLDYWRRFFLGGTAP